MSEQALQPKGLAVPTLRVIGGPMTGQQFQIHKKTSSIGRSSENDIVLKNDGKCSRQHALLKITSQGFSIESLNQNNPVYMNGQPVDTAIISPGIHLAIGESELLLDAPSQAAISPPSGLKKKRQRQTAQRRAQKRSPMFNIILGVVVLGAVYLVTTEQANEKKTTPITTAQDIEAEIKAARKIQQDQELAARKSNQKSVQHKEAQSLYLKGFRDYEKGLYSRAKDSFQTCLTLYPEHILCKRYHGLSNRKLDEIVQYSLRLGKDHRERNQFRACMNSMRNVMIMVKNKSDKRFQQAKAHYEACDSLLGDGF